MHLISIIQHILDMNAKIQYRHPVRIGPRGYMWQWSISSCFWEMQGNRGLNIEAECQGST